MLECRLSGVDGSVPCACTGFAGTAVYLVVANVPALMCSIGISKESSYAGLLLNLHERYPELLWDNAPLHAVHWKLLLQRLPALACLLLWKAALNECLASSSSPGGGPKAYLKIARQKALLNGAGAFSTASLSLWARRPS